MFVVLRDLPCLESELLAFTKTGYADAEARIGFHLLVLAEAHRWSMPGTHLCNSRNAVLISCIGNVTFAVVPILLRVVAARRNARPAP